MKIILASASPRRRELLTQMGLDYEVIPAQGEEQITKENPAEAVEELALGKTTEVYEKILRETTEDILVIGADTVVVYEDQILGKPKDEADAVFVLNQLQDHTHQVYTGVAICISRNGKCTTRVFHEKTDVTMYPMTQEEIRDYVSDGKPGNSNWRDKAGGYGIQEPFGMRVVKQIHGDYNNVIGLPVARLYQELRKEDIFTR